MVGDEAFVVLIQGDVVEQSWFEFGGQANILDRLRPKGRGCQIVTRVIRFGGSCRLSARLSVYIPDDRPRSGSSHGHAYRLTESTSSGGESSSFRFLDWASAGLGAPAAERVKVHS